MSGQEPINPQTKDEIDLGQLVTLIKQGFSNLFNNFLLLYGYIKRNIIILVILGVIGIALGIGWKKFTTQQQKTEIIVSPKLDSKHYLFDAVEEINGKIKSQDSAFISSLGFEVGDVKGMKIEVEPLSMRSKKEQEADLKYLEVLKSFQSTPGVADIIRELLLDQNTSEQRLTFYYKNPKIGVMVADKIMLHLNSNAYFNELLASYNQNATQRIQQNDTIISQVDGIIAAYRKKLETEDSASEGQLVLDEGETVNISALFALKNELIAQNDAKRIELQKRKKPITIINIGQSHPLEAPFFSKSLVFFPTVLIAVFFLIAILRYLNKKEKEL